MNKLTSLKPAALVLTSVLLLQGCDAAIVAGGLSAASTAHDRRSLGVQVDDNTVEMRASRSLSSLDTKDAPTHIGVDVFNSVALLTGQVSTRQQQQQAEQQISELKGISKVHNQLRVMPPTEASTRTYDIWLASKVRANLLTDNALDGLHISVIVEDSEVFLMGIVSRKEAGIAVEIARNIDGVARVVKAFEYL